MNVLVVDDDPDIRRIARLALERPGGFRVVLAADGTEALEAIARQLPDVVLLDVSMPGADGPATLRAMRSIAGAEQIPVIFFTATSNESEVARLRALGAVGVVAKPFDFAELAARVRGILGPIG
jgi:two-component system OmpR family response regulator